MKHNNSNNFSHKINKYDIITKSYLLKTKLKLFVGRVLLHALYFFNYYIF